VHAVLTCTVDNAIIMSWCLTVAYVVTKRIHFTETGHSNLKTLWIHKIRTEVTGHLQLITYNL